MELVLEKPKRKSLNATFQDAKNILKDDGAISPKRLMKEAIRLMEEILEERELNKTQLN